MKLTIQSQAALTPTLHQAKPNQPSRISGELEIKTLRLPATKTATADSANKNLAYICSNNNSIDQPTQFLRAFDRLGDNQQQSTSIDIKNLQLSHNKINRYRVAVYAVSFDGNDSWYQVWDKRSQRVCWIKHRSDMDYQPFANIVMNEMMKLVPNSAIVEEAEKTVTMDFTIFDSVVSVSGNMWLLASSELPLHNK